MRRILVIRFSALGDVAMLAAVLKQLSVPDDVRLTVLSQNRLAPLFMESGDKISFAGADLKGRHKGMSGLNVLLQDINYRQYDAVVDCHNVLRSRYLDLRFRMAGKQVVIMPKTRWAKWWLTCPWNKRKQALTPMPEQYSKVLNRALHVATTGKQKPTSSQASGKEGHGIGIAPFAAHAGKIYPTDKMEQVVAALSQKGEKVYLFGGGTAETAILETWANKYPNTESVAGKKNMAEELDIMRRLRLMVTMDSGNMHMASLVGTRVISIWGATHPMAGFLGIGQNEQDCVQRDLPCRPCSIYGNKQCRYGDYRCLDITPEDIIKLCESS